MLDFRSDTVTTPTAAMRVVMAEAPVGDDVFADDPTVNALQTFAASQLGFADALFAPSGTMTNLIALMAHCQRGDEAIVGQYWHTYRWEGGGMAVLGSIQPQPLAQQADGSIALADIVNAIKPDDPHFARTRLIVMENTTGGKVLSEDYMQQVAQLAKQHNLACHIDGARLLNAAAALAVDGDVFAKARELCRGYDSLSLCLSKGLGAPVGSLLLGDRDFIAKARRIRKMLGGGMRQAGILAAAGLYALQHHSSRLVDDHAMAKRIAGGMAELIQEFQLESLVNVDSTPTNMLFLTLAQSIAPAWLQAFDKAGIRVTHSPILWDNKPAVKIRFVTHLDLPASACQQLLTTCRNIITRPHLE